MSAKRKASESPQGLIGRPSPYHPSVTLFQPNSEPSSSPTVPLTTRRSPRRQKIVKREDSMDSTEKSTVTGDTSALTNSTVLKSPKAATASTSSDVKPDSTTHAKASQGGSPRKRKSASQASGAFHPAPPRWREAYDKIKEMRSRVVAPVDTMGCGRAQLFETIPKNQRFATLVSLMLSSQTKDEVTSAAVDRLREAVGGSLSVDAILRADDSTISDAICKVGFWRRKTEYIKRTAQRLHDDFDSDVPKTVEELCTLPGVGPKMAILALHVGWKVNAGVGVDVHVHRITNRLGWHNPPTKTPEETRSNLESWLPKELRPTFTGLLVGFGQTICLPIGPHCDSCLLSDGLCPSARAASPRRSPTKKRVVVASTSRAAPKLEIAMEDAKDEIL
ncbi:DNA glycosylase [Laetiporus sulphureus 93-53]|uniref:Endonuclease III homolog n=1 Tax=Laetiporus sulphureus 93-53 TaxID=1314785 RepID=A0A165H2E5_9APHY|nr:DNA glycosylase [Laetiporus sulphureus 93-53]KZT11151.1 DNA glycosylase [Laetiporus sulphureus 93-53]